MSSGLRICAVSNRLNSFLGRELREVAEKRGHEYNMVSFMTTPFENVKDALAVKEIEEADVVYYRTGPGPVFAKILEDHLAEKNIPTVGFYGSTAPYIHRKSYQIYTVASAGFLTPKTVLTVSKEYEEIQKLFGGFFVAKDDVGSCGHGVSLVKDATDYEKVPTDWKRGDHIFQEYIPHEHELRMHIIEGKVVAQYLRKAKEGDFRTNLSQGGKAMSVEDMKLVETATPMAEKIASLFGMEIGAVDFLLSEKDGMLYFLEANMNPGWSTMIKRAIGSDMASLMMDYFEKVAKEKGREGGDV